MAIAPAPCTYQRRRPELTPCYRIIQEHLRTFIAAREAEGRPLPDYISAEFDAYLKCGMLDGVYTRYGELGRFRNLDPITDDEVAGLIQTISSKVLALCVRRGYLSRDGEQGGPMKKISAITDPIQVCRYLKHVNIDYEPPARAPPRYQQGEFDFEGGQYHSEGGPLGT